MEDKIQKLVQGFGINDLDFKITTFVWEDGRMKQKHDPIYSTWKHMVFRAKSKIWHAKYPCYSDVDVFLDWKFASKFYSWAEPLYSPGKQLDKDILGDGKIYSPYSCCFISKRVNQFLIGSTRQSKYPMGVYKEPGRAKFKVMIGAGEQHKNEHIGSFENMWEGHLAYSKRKIELAHILISEEDVEDYIASALIAKLQKKVDEAEILYQQSLI